ncbi:MAG TPA: hypothetical protein VNN08_16800 [Thermoanaerobaculia bacterium]|nr:hypothetical protein [Thermoanaerobaculia bacterium]
MRRAPADAIRTSPELALVAHISPPVLKRAVPVALEPLDPFAEPEPSQGASIELASGRLVVVVYGLQTEHLSLHAVWPDAAQAVDDFLRESRLDQSSIEWVDPRLPAELFADQGRMLTTRG